MNRYFLTAIFTLGILTASSVATTAPRWLMTTPSSNGAFFQIDLSSIRLVENNIYQYKHRLYNPDNSQERRYTNSYDGVDCNNSMMSMMARFSGSKGDRRIHEIGWSTVSATEKSTSGEMFRAVCNYVKKNPIPRLEANWDKKPESYYSLPGSLIRHTKLRRSLITQFLEAGDVRYVDPGHPKYDGRFGSVLINKKGDKFTGVPKAVWEFYVGGY